MEWTKLKESPKTRCDQKYRCLQLETCFVYLTVHINRPRRFSPSSCCCSPRVLVGSVAEFRTFSAEQIAAAPLLELACENMLRASFIHENVTSAIRVQKIRNAAIFAATDSTAEELKDTCKETFFIDASEHGATNKVEWANVHHAWFAAKMNVEVKTKEDADSRRSVSDCSIQDAIRTCTQFFLSRSRNDNTMALSKPKH